MTTQIKTKMDIKGYLINPEGWDDEAAHKLANINHFEPEYAKRKKLNSINIVIVGLLTMFLSSTAVAGPDWEIIHMAEEYKLSHERALTSNDMKKNVVLLDHGPRAITTPYMNEERKSELKQPCGSRNSDSPTGVGLAQPGSIGVTK